MRELNPWQRRSNGREAHRQFYAKYMRSPAWFSRREQWAEEELALLPVGGTIVCVGCGRGWFVRRDDLHHYSYERLGDEAHEDLWPMCRDCHVLLHEVMRSSRSWRKLATRQANELALAVVQERVRDR